MGGDEASLGFQDLFEIFPGVCAGDVRFAEIAGAFQEVGLNFVEQGLDVSRDAFHADGGFFLCIPAGNFHHIVLEVAGTNGHADRDAFQFVFGEFPARTCVVGIVVLHGNAHGLEFLHDLRDLLIDQCLLVVALVDGHDDDL